MNQNLISILPKPLFAGADWTALSGEEKAVWVHKAAELQEEILANAPRVQARTHSLINRPTSNNSTSTIQYSPFCFVFDDLFWLVLILFSSFNAFFSMQCLQCYMHLFHAMLTFLKQKPVCFNKIIVIQKYNLGGFDH